MRYAPIVLAAPSATLSSTVLSHARPAYLPPVLARLLSALLPRSSNLLPPTTLPPCRSSSSFVAPSHRNFACGHFLLHEHLEVLLTCAGGYVKESACMQILACTMTCNATCTAATTATTTTTSPLWQFIVCK